MSGSTQLDITIVEAQLVRIFDSLKSFQDISVQLVCGYEDGTEKVVGRTAVCRGGNLHPRWNERFLCAQDKARGGKTLKFQVYVDHNLRTPTLCGEAEFGLSDLWGRATAGMQKALQAPLSKRGEQTGVLAITIGIQEPPAKFTQMACDYVASPSPHSSLQNCHAGVFEQPRQRLEQQRMPQATPQIQALVEQRTALHMLQPTLGPVSDMFGVPSQGRAPPQQPSQVLPQRSQATPYAHGQLDVQGVPDVHGVPDMYGRELDRSRGPQAQSVQSSHAAQGYSSAQQIQSHAGAPQQQHQAVAPTVLYSGALGQHQCLPIGGSSLGNSSSPHSIPWWGSFIERG